MKCADCPRLKILYAPLHDDKGICEFGKAKCTKYELYTDFSHKGKFTKLECVEENGMLEKLKENKDVR